MPPYPPPPPVAGMKVEVLPGPRPVPPAEPNPSAITPPQAWIVAFPDTVKGVLTGRIQPFDETSKLLSACVLLSEIAAPPLAHTLYGPVASSVVSTSVLV